MYLLEYKLIIMIIITYSFIVLCMHILIAYIAAFKGSTILCALGGYAFTSCLQLLPLANDCHEWLKCLTTRAYMQTVVYERVAFETEL